MKISPSLLLIAASLALAGCGGGTKTVTVTRTLTTIASASTRASSSTTSSTSTSSLARASPSHRSTTSLTTTTTATFSTASTRTETGPAFVTGNPNSETAAGPDLAAAIALMARHGYVPVETSSYSRADTLRVLIGRRSNVSRPAERAFFFDQATYLGTDAAQPSASVAVVSHADTEVVLSYAIYARGAGGPSGRRRLVHFALDMGQLSPLEAIPSVAKRR